MTTTTNEFGQQNMFAKEPQMYIDSEVQTQMDNGVYETHNEKAERLNGRLAMIGFIAAIGAYALTGQIIPGIW
ncbi:high light inducible protein [Synechococcus phage S-CREM1]|nr:high light inducible protein [Synechococcus phage S-CREM1]